MSAASSVSTVGTDSAVSTSLDELPVAPPGVPGITRPWQVEDLLDLPGPYRHEIVDGGLLTMPAPRPLHQWLCQELFVQLTAQAPPEWRPTLEEGVPTGGTDYRVPDLTVSRSRGRPRKGELLVDLADLALVVEITLTTEKQDRVLKPVEYAAVGIPFFWRLEAEPGFVLVAHELRGDRYAETGRWVEGRVSPVGPFPVVVDLDALRGDED